MADPDIEHQVSASLVVGVLYVHCFGLHCSWLGSIIELDSITRLWVAGLIGPIGVF
jgi:hypothetical protein